MRAALFTLAASILIAVIFSGFVLAAAGKGKSAAKPPAQRYFAHEQYE